MKKYLKDYAELLSAIVLIFYILGFCYQFWYYQYFNIEIQYYVSLTDIIFQSIGNIILSILLFLGIEIVLTFITEFWLGTIYSFKNSEKFESLRANIKNRAERYLKHLIDRERHGYMLFLCLIFMFIGIFIVPDPMYFAPLMFVNFIYHLYRVSEKFNKSNPGDSFMKNFSMIFVFIILLFTYCYWGLSDAWSVKSEYSSKVIKIGSLSTGDDVNKFIGETSSYIFVLNTRSSDVIVYNKENNNTFIISKNKYAIKEVENFMESLKEFKDRIHFKP